MTVHQCYEVFTLALILNNKHLGILSWIQDKSLKKIAELPSWVPDFSLRSANNPVPEHFNAIPADLQLIRPFRLPHYDDQPKKLGVFGYRFDCIKAVASPRHLGSANKFKLDASWFSLCLHLNATYHNGQSRTEALWRTLCRDQDSHGKHPAPPELQQSFKQLLCAMICEKAEKRFDECISMWAGLVRCAEIKKTGHADASVVANAILEQQVAIREGKRLGEEDFDHVQKVLWILELLASTELASEAVAISNSHTPSPLQIENYFRHPDRFYPPTQDVEVLLDSRGGISIRPGPDYKSRAETESTSSRGVRAEAVKPFGRAFQLAYSGKRLFVTCNKYIGLGPVSMEEGDCIYLLPGTRAPFVLRRVDEVVADGEEVSQRFSVVGEAYIHGIMHGEALREGSALREKAEQIYLV